jgi:hypothetical protein
MTDTALAEPLPTVRRSRGVRPRRALPPGVPAWVRLLGVYVVPLDPDQEPAGEGAPHGWVVSAGVGAGHVSALFFDESKAG